MTPYIAFYGNGSWHIRYNIPLQLVSWSRCPAPIHRCRLESSLYPIPLGDEIPNKKPTNPIKPTLLKKIKPHREEKKALTKC